MAKLKGFHLFKGGSWQDFYGEGVLPSALCHTTLALSGSRAMYDWAEFRHFRYLLKILEKGGFRAAAEELYTSQPNLTVQARQFQDHASVRLFRRLKNGQVRPTETGIAFIALARLVLEVREEVINALIAIERGEVTLIRFGSTPLADQNLFRTLCALHKELLPTCAIRPTHGDAAHLAQEVLDGMVDAAIVTLPLTHPDLQVELLRRDRIVVCLRKEDVLAAKAVVQTSDLQDKLAIFYHPQRHPDAHARLIELLGDAGVSVQECSRASHPSEMQALVKEGHGLALIREGTLLEEGLTTRPILGVDWTVDTAAIYHRQAHPKTVPILVRRLKRMILNTQSRDAVAIIAQPLGKRAKRPAQSAREQPTQLSLYRDLSDGLGDRAG